MRFCVGGTLHKWIVWKRMDPWGMANYGKGGGTNDEREEKEEKGKKNKSVRTETVSSPTTEGGRKQQPGSTRTGGPHRWTRIRPGGRDQGEKQQNNTSRGKRRRNSGQEKGQR